MPASLGTHEESLQAFRRHFDLITATYGSVTCLDMLDGRGIEQELQGLFEAAVASQQVLGVG